MKLYSFIPFSTRLAALEGAELACLREVSQGWYVEYSEMLPPTPTLAKQLSAFANQSGGWLFAGVKREEKGRTEASGFPGLPCGAAEEALSALHEAATRHVTPEVLFESKVIEGPVPEIGLARERCLIIAGVPQGANPPYIHSSGRIYQRGGNCTSPVPLTSRRELGVLRSRARETQQRLSQFLSLRATVQERENAGPVRVYVYFLGDPFLMGGPLGLTQEAFSDVMRSSGEDDLVAADFDALFTTADGYVAGNAKDHAAPEAAAAFRWWANGNARLSVPVESCDLIEFSRQSDPRRSDFVRMLRGHGFTQARIADFSPFMALLACAAGKYVRLREILGLGGRFWGKVRFCEAAGTVPFINLRQYVDSINIYGFPAVEEADFYSPQGLSTDDLIAIEPGGLGGAKDHSILAALRLAASAFRAVGIDFDRFIREDPKGFLHDLAESMDIAVGEEMIDDRQ